MNLVDTLGRIQVASPASEWVHIALRRNASQSINTATTTALQYDALLTARGVVVGDWWSSSVNPERVTVPAGYAGMYVMEGHLRHSASTAGTNRSILIRVNGVNLTSQLNNPRATATDVHQAVATAGWLNEGDYVELCAYQDSGGTLSITGADNRFSISRLPLGVPYSGGITAPGLKFEWADRDGHGDYEPLTNASWEGSSKAGGTSINWNSVFGVPAYAISVVVILGMVDNSADNQYVYLKAASTTSNQSLLVYGAKALKYYFGQGVVPIMPDGTSYFYAVGTIDLVWLRVIGWWHNEDI